MSRAPMSHAQMNHSMTGAWRRLRPSPRQGIALLLVLALVGVAWWQSSRQERVPYDPADTGNMGLRGLVLWLEALDHPVTTTPRTRTLPPHDGLIVLHPNVNLVPEGTARRLRTWVEQGGTLVLVGPNVQENALVDTFGVQQVGSQALALSVRQGQPLLPEAQAEWSGILTTQALQPLDDADLLPVLVNTYAQAVVAIQPAGAGRIWHLTEDFALTNLHLRDERIATLVPAMLRTVAPNAPVLLLGGAGTFRPDLPMTVQRWLYASPIGWGLLALTAILLIYLVLQGWRLGPPLVETGPAHPRPAADYVHAMATLQRRARQRSALVAHHRARLKAALARAGGVDPELTDAAWIEALQRSDRLPAETVQQAAALMAAFGRDPDEATLIKLVRDADALIATLPRTHAGQTAHRRA